MTTIRTRTIALLSTLAMLATLLVAGPASAAPMTDQENVSFSAAGLTSQYHVFADGIDTSQPVGLLLQFHGDGAYEFDNPSSDYSLGGSDGIVANAREHNLITVAVRTPDLTQGITWWQRGSQNADYVEELLSHLRNEYPVEDDRTWLVGYSGGAQFITQFYLPKYSSTVVGGGSIVFGGGGTPYTVTVQPFPESLKQQFPMHWYTGLNDDGSGGTYNALRDARNGSDWYAARGFDTDLETPAGVGHNLWGVFGPVVGGHLDDHVGSEPPPAPEPCDGESYALVGDWNGNGIDGIGWWCDGKTKLRENTGEQHEFTYGRAGDVPISADWDGDGQDTVSIIRDGTWHVNNQLRGGASERTFHYGRVTQGDVPIAGDWNRGGVDLPGIIRDREWHLRSSQSGGSATWQFIYGRLTAGDLPLVGDWNDDGRDTAGIVREGRWHLRNVHAGGNSDIEYTYGRVLSGDIPVVGDWTGDNVDTPGIVRDGDWHLKYDHGGGPADTVIQFSSP